MDRHERGYYKARSTAASLSRPNEDGDGLDDVYELQEDFLDPLHGARRASGSWTVTGFSNLEEYGAGSALDQATSTPVRVLLSGLVRSIEGGAGGWRGRAGSAL